ncbi:MAG: hypothetical protein ABJC74_11930 [Gemmatimonadota bacterium]
MNRSSILGTLAGVLLASSPVAAQQRAHLFVQGLLGPVSRSDHGLSSASPNGVFAMARGGVLLNRHLGVISELSVSNFAGQRLAFPSRCVSCNEPVPGYYDNSGIGVGVVGLGIGLQPQLQIGPIALMASGTFGGYLSYHASPVFPGLTPGVRGSVGLGLPIGDRFHALLEVGGTHFLNHAMAEVNSRTYDIGFAFN